eukprot:7086371-Pyramimonas_sp.AAC.1
MYVSRRCIYNVDVYVRFLPRYQYAVAHGACASITESDDEMQQDTLSFILALSDYDTFYEEMMRIASEKARGLVFYIGRHWQASSNTRNPVTL